MQAGIGKGLHRIALGRLANGGGGDRLALPGMWIVGGDLTEACAKIGQPITMRGHRPAVFRPVCALQHRVQADRHLDAGPLLDRVTQFVLGREKHVRLIVLHLLAHFAPGDLRTQQTVAGVGTGHQGGMRVATRDARAGLTDQALLQHADARQHGMRVGSADRAPDRAGRIGIAPAAARHGDRLHPGQG